MGGPMRSQNKVCGRLCVEISAVLISPLSIGSGETEHSAGDVIINAKGVPFIPGSSLAGAVRAYLSALEGEANIAPLLGAIYDAEPGGEADRQSRMFFYDAVFENPEMGIRDGVKLDENKTAVHMGKYERQVVEGAAPFKLRLEVIRREWGNGLADQKSVPGDWKSELKWIGLLVRGFSRGELRLGAKSRRGFGKIGVDKVRIKRFDMTDRNSHLQWLNWDWNQEGAFEGLEAGDVWEPESVEKNASSIPWGSLNGSENDFGNGLEHTLEIPLRIQHTLLVRSYSTAFLMAADMPDYGQMTVGSEGEVAVIPGSSWAGAFRSHIVKIIIEQLKGTDWQKAQDMLEELFGTWVRGNERKKDLKASKITFEETVVKGGWGIPMARTAIDRFTGGSLNGALYKEIPWAGGTVVLRIRWRKGKKELDEAICGMLLWAIKDLQEGFLAVGGETGIGRGIFESTDGGLIRRDDSPFAEEEQIEYRKAASRWLRGKMENQEGRESHEEI